MKQFIKILAVTVVAFASASTCMAQKLFTEVSSIQGVTSIFVGKAMISRAAIPPVNVQGGYIDISNLARQLESIEIISFNRSIASQVNPICEKVIEKLHPDLIAEAKDSFQSVEISGVFNKKGDRISTLIIRTCDNFDTVYIVLRGDIDPDALSSSLMIAANNLLLPLPLFPCFHT